MSDSVTTRPTVDILVQRGVLVTMDAAKRVLFDGALAIDQGRIVLRSELPA